MSYSVYLQNDFGSAQTNVMWQLYDSNGLIGSPSASGITTPITGVYVSLIDVTGAVGVQWTCDNGALTSRVPLGDFIAIQDAYFVVAQEIVSMQSTLVKIKAAVYDSATLSGSTLTLSNAATMVVSSSGRVTTG